MKVVVAAFNQEKALIGAFSVITNLRMELFQALINTPLLLLTPDPAVKYLNINPFYLSSSPENSL